MEILAVTVWLIIGVFALGGSMWLALFALGRLYNEPPRTWGSDDVHVRVMTVGENVDVIQRTVSEAARYLDDIHVVSEQNIDIDQATVHVVPEDFESDAIRKGRAHDWAAQHLEHDREYVLYLDEDTTVTGFDGLPDRDIVQFMELPQYSDSFFSWLTEVHRVGYQREIRAFPNISYPLYLWGGAFAVRASVEQEIGWGVESITEDTAFLWKAFSSGVSYCVTEQWFKNQAPPSVRELINQRRRWFAGTRQAAQYLPRKWRWFVWIRAVMWISSMFTGYVVVAGLLSPVIPLWLTIALFVLLIGWSILGARRYDRRIISLVGTLLFFPVIHTLNALGVFYGLIWQPDDFEVTTKK